MRIAFYTLGCKVNQNESGSLMRLFCDNGFVPAQENEPADVYVVNSCTVTASGDKKSRQWLRRAKRENPSAVTVLTGCYPQAFPEEARKVTEADIITGSGARGRLLSYVLRCLETGERIFDVQPHEKEELFEDLPRERMTGRNRAFLKIEDGCNRRCAYCVIPRARGYVRSRAEESILAELQALASEGYAEVVFSGVNLSSYGKDTGTGLAELVEKAAQINGISRIRLSSLEPDLMDEVTVRRLAAVPALCPQFHLALQSGCDATLRRMRRIYTTAEYRALVQQIRALLPHATFTTDMIVGFPGETEEEFAQSLRFAQEMRFLKVHVFSYSRREGTPAYDMPMQIANDTKLARSHALQTAADAVRAELMQEMKGSEAEVLLEKPLNATLFTGYTRAYVPVLVNAPAHRQGDVVRVRLGAFDNERCAAVLVE